MQKGLGDSLGIKNTSLLSDFWHHGGVAQTYGVFRDNEGVAKRSSILVDENGAIAFVKTYDTKQLPDMEEVIEAIKKL